MSEASTRKPWHEMTEEERRELVGQQQIARYVPPRYKEAHTHNQPALSWIAAPHDSCYISGPVGSGKTYLAWALLKRWLVAEAPCRPTLEAHYVGELLHVLRPGNAKVIRGSTLWDNPQPDRVVDHFRDVCNADMVLLDDLGTDKLTDWGLEQLTTIINSRYNHMKPTIVTSNLAPAEIGSTIGDRLASRFMHHGTVIPVIGADRRRPTA